jgi:hypothetical protein
VETPIQEAAAPETSASLSAQHLRAYVVEREGEPVLLLHDGETAIEISGEIGRPEAAAFGVERVSSAAADFARVMWERAAQGLTAD